MANSNEVMSLEQFNAKFGDLPEDQRRAVARSLKVKLPFEAKPVSEQIKAAKIGKHTTKGGKEREYIMFPTLQVSEDETVRSVWVPARHARDFAAQLLKICDTNGF